MSAVSSQLSFRSPHPNPRVFNIMDSIYAIAFGLGLRTLLDAVSQNFKLTGSLIGLWEGVITLHFLKKMPKSSDPYIALGVRLFIDFLVTESVERLVLVLIWTAFGMVLADVAPGVWDEVGLKRVWRHFRRDLYTIYDKIPKVAFFPPPRTVRFLPSREPSIVSPSIITSQDTPIAVVPPSSSAPSEPLKNRVPGYFPGDYSDTETDRGSIIRSRPSPRTEVNDALVSDLDDGNQSSAASSSDSTEMGDTPSLNREDIPDMEEEQALVDIREADPDPTTPKQQPKYLAMPPTPSDSAARWDLHRDVVDDVLHGRTLPNIPDSVEDGGTSDGWEKIQQEELDEPEDRAPTPPAKDRRVGSSNVSVPVPVPIISNPVPPVPPVASTNPYDDIDFLDLNSSQLLMTTTGQRRESVPPPYDDCEDMYYNSPPRDKEPTAATTTVDNEHADNNHNDNNDLAKLSRHDEDVDINSGAINNPWAGASASFDAVAQAQADAAKKLMEEEARIKTEEAEKVQKEEEKVRKEEERIRKEEEERFRKEEERIRKEEEERIQKEEEERIRKEEKRKEAAAERRKKEEDDAALRKQKLEDEKAAKKRKREEEAEQKRVAEEAEQKRNEEEATKKRKEKEEAEQKRKEEEATKKRREEEEFEQKRREEEAEQKKRDEEAIKKREEEEAEQKRQEEEAEQKRKEEEATKKRREEEEAEQKKREEEAIKKREEEEAIKKREEEEVIKKREEEEAIKKREEEEATKKREEEDQKARDGTEKQKQEEAHTQKETETTETEREEAHETSEEVQENLESDANEADRTTRTEAEQAELGEQQVEVAGGQRMQEDEDDSKTLHDPYQNHERRQLALPAPANMELMHDPYQSPERRPLALPAPANMEPMHDLYQNHESHQLALPAPANMEEGSVTSEVSAHPSDQAGERLERMMILRAQMVELEQRLVELKNERGFDEESPELKAVEKSLRKFQRQAEKRYAAGVKLAEFEISEKDKANMTLDGLNPRQVKVVLEELLEQLLVPTSRSINFKLTAAKSKKDVAIHKPFVLGFLEKYNLFHYTKPDEIKRKESLIEVSEGQFAEWLTEYRALAAKHSSQGDDEGGGGSWVRA